MQKTQPSTLLQVQVRSPISIFQWWSWLARGFSSLSRLYHFHLIYDSMIAKIIVHGENRFDALMKMQRALYELEIEGVQTNADFQLDLISDRNVIAGDYDTSFLMETFLPKYQEKEIKMTSRV